MAKAVAPRFGIGEWYGRSFANLTVNERGRLAVVAQAEPNDGSPECPFIGSPCPKRGGICSLRLYQLDDPATGAATVVEGEEGDLRVICPHRFKQDDIIYKRVGEVVLGTSKPIVVDEIRFLKRLVAKGKKATGREDVGNIDNVVIHPDLAHFKWCALEIQAVYFSGDGMDSLFKYIEFYREDGIPFPDKTRRPDYRSSGPKRLMPQFQIKVPTLRRWGKKMAAVVDAAWFRKNVIGVETVDDLSSCDIAWFIVEFDESTDPATIVVAEPTKHTLEKAVEGLTGGTPVTQPEFEKKIRDKIAKSEPKKDRGQ